jgi:hypothetical protein
MSAPRVAFVSSDKSFDMFVGKAVPTAYFCERQLSFNYQPPDSNRLDPQYRSDLVNGHQIRHNVPPSPPLRRFME